MKLPTRIRATRKNGKTVVAVLIKNADIRARATAGPGYNSRMKFNSRNDCVAQIFTGAQAATDPLIKFEIDEMRPGAELSVSWKDSHGYHSSARTAVS